MRSRDGKRGIEEREKVEEGEEMEGEIEAELSKKTLWL